MEFPWHIEPAGTTQKNGTEEKIEYSFECFVLRGFHAWYFHVRYPFSMFLKKPPERNKKVRT